MSGWINRPGCSRREFNNFPFDRIGAHYHASLTHWLQGVLWSEPHNIDKAVECPPQEQEGDWKVAVFRQFLIELNSFAFDHAAVSSLRSEPMMEFPLRPGGEAMRFMLEQPGGAPRAVPAIDYVASVLESASAWLLDSRRKWEDGAKHARRLYRCLHWSYARHREVFNRVEGSTHLMLRFTLFARRYRLIPDNQFFVDEAELRSYLPSGAVG